MTFVQKEFKTSLRKEQRHRRSRPAGHKKAPQEEGREEQDMHILLGIILLCQIFQLWVLLALLNVLTRM